MSFYSKDVVASPLHKYLAGNAPVGDLLDETQEEPKGLAIDVVSGKILVRDRDDYAIDKFAGINPTRNEDRKLDGFGSPKFILDKDGKLRKTSINRLSNSNDLTGFGSTNVTTSFSNQNTLIEDVQYAFSRHNLFQMIPAPIGDIVTNTVKVKPNGHTNVYVGFLGTGSVSPCYGVVVNLLTGEIFNHVGMQRGTQENTTAAVTELDDGYYKIKVEMKNDSSASTYFAVGPCDVPEPGTFDYYSPKYVGGAGTGILVTDAQVAPLDQSEIFVPCVKSNQVEIPIQHKYNSVTDIYEPVGILIEQQSTNLFTNCFLPNGPVLDFGPDALLVSAADFDFGPFTKSGLTLPITNSVVAFGYQIFTLDAAKQYTASFYCYSHDGDPPVIKDYDASATNDFFFNVSAITGGAANIVVEDVAPNLYRIYRTGAGAGAVGYFGPVKYAGNSDRLFTLTGFQLEEGSVPTSLIETNASTVTRTADLPTILTADFPWNEDQGTFIVKYSKSETDLSGVLGAYNPNLFSNRDFFYLNNTPSQYIAGDYSNSLNVLNSTAAGGFQKFVFTFDSVGSTLAHQGSSNTNLGANNWSGTELLRLGTRFGVANGTCLIESIVYKPYRITEQQAEYQAT